MSKVIQRAARFAASPLAYIILLGCVLPVTAWSQQPPFTQCPAIGLNSSCRILVVIDAQGNLQTLTDPNVATTYDGSDDTLIGVVNNSPNNVSAILLGGADAVFNFDGDGICDDSIQPHPGGCPFGPTGYEGPGISFSAITSDSTSGTVTFNPPLKPGQTAYFGLEVAIQTVAAVPSLSGKGLGNGCPGSCQVGNPIDLGTGNKFEAITDYETTGPNTLRFTRYYNSRGASDTIAASLGVNWRSTYDRYLNTSASFVSAERADGQVVSFTLSGNTWFSDSDIDLKLTQTGATWTLTDIEDTVETYATASTGLAILTSIRMRNGYQQTLQRGPRNQLLSVTDSFNRILNFTYDNDLLQTIATPDGLTVSYGYTSSGIQSGVLDQLATVTYSTNPETSQSYLYDNGALPFALTGIIDENGTPYATWTYDQFARGLSSQHAGAELTTIAYNDADGSRTVTNALGAQTVYRFSNIQGVPKLTEVDRLPTSTTAAASLTFTYDANGYVSSQTNWSGNLTTYANDTHGQPISITEAAGTPQARTRTTTYHANFHLPVNIVEPGLTTTLTYDATGNLLTKTHTDTTTSTVPYSTNGQTRAWTYTWSNGLLASVREPRTDVAAVTKFAYDSGGALTATTNALGQVTKVAKHLPDGLPQTIVDANGVTTDLAYDARLRLLTRTLATADRPLATKYGYNVAGNLIRVTLPDGSALINSYDDAHRLTGTADLFSQSITYTLDVLGNRTQTSILDATGTQQLQHSFSFDALGRLLQDTGGAAQATSYSYDANGNVLSVTDPLKRVTQQSFDALNRRVKITDPAKGVTTRSYDAHDRPLSVTDPNGNTTTYIYDGFGEVIQRVSPDTGTTVYHYDLDGNLIQSLDAGGAVANYSYDALDRVLTTTYPADPAENVAYSYDQTGHGFGVGRLTSVTDAAGALTRSYDERGNVLSATRTVGAATLLTSYSYDAASRVASITYPSGWTVKYTRDSMGRIAAASAQSPDGATTLPVASNMGYQPFGPVNTVTFGNSVSEARSFDLDYRLVALNDAGTTAIQGLTYGYDAANNVSSIADAVTAGNTQSLGYDALDRLTSATGSYGKLGYTYDPVGNRLTESTGGSVSTTYAYSPTSSQLISTNANGVIQPVGYSAAGNISSFAPLKGPIASFNYNQAGRLATVKSGDNQVAQYTYDAFGHRLIKIGAATSTTLFQYDGRGDLLEESDDQGKALVDYVYLDGIPLATIQPSNGQMYFLHTDRLGTPQVATDASQSVVWSAAYQPFGFTSTGPGVIVQNLRLPGQEFDVDTGWNHNGFRDYVSGWGRYLQSDPIGLAGGMNTYVYANANPQKFVDQTGTAFTITLYSGVLGYNHVGVGVNAVTPLDTSGFYSSNPRDPALLIGRTISGKEAPDSFDLPIEWITFVSSPEVDQAIQEFISARQQDPGRYGLYVRNCATTVVDALRAAGVRVPSTIYPNDLFNYLKSNQVFIQSQLVPDVLRYEIGTAVEH